MFKKFIIFALIVSCSSAIFAQKDYSTQWKEAYKLYRSRKYAEVIPIFVKLAESTSEPGRQYNCYIHAAYSARNLKKYDEAIAFADKAGKVQNPYKYKAMIIKLDFKYNSRKYQKIIDMYPIDTIMKWPKHYRSNAFFYIGMAQYSLKKGEDAEKTFQLGHEHAESQYWQGYSLLKSGHNYRHRLKDTEKATEKYLAIIELSKASNHHKSEAYDGIADILISQKKNDEALAEYDKLLAMEKVSAYWKSCGLYKKGNLLKKMGKTEDAIKCYNQAVATRGCNSWVKKGCQKQLKKLQPKAE